MADPQTQCPRDLPDRRIVVIDDDEIMLLSCSEVLTRSGYQVETFASGEEGIQRLEEHPAPLLLVDLKMPKIDGMEVIRRVRQFNPSIVIVVITGYATIATAVDAMKAGAYDFLPKPFTPDELSLIVNRGLERWHLVRESERLRQEKAHVQRRFVTFVSHQLKTPLVAIKQYLDVLMFSLGDKLPAQASEWIGRSQTRAAEMLEIIHDWLDLSRLEHGQLCSADASADLLQVVQQVVQGLAPLADRAGVRLEVALPHRLPPVRGEAGSLGMLLSNLLSNAIKYNRAGGSVTLNASGGETVVVLEIIDTGLGIPQEQIGKLFQEFYRVKTESTQGIPGTGLGLAICKKIVSELGGRIDLSSTEGAGTTVTVQLPLCRSDSPPEPEQNLKPPG